MDCDKMELKNAPKSFQKEKVINAFKYGATNGVTWDSKKTIALNQIIIESTTFSNSGTVYFIIHHRIQQSVIAENCFAYKKTTYKRIRNQNSIKCKNEA